MTSKVIIFLACVALASAGLLPEKNYLESVEENDPHPNYEFSYNVADLETGDIKSQRESRDGESVHGQYTLNDADGYKRIVDYTVNGESGFNAVVRREPLQSENLVAKPAATTPKPLAPPQPIVKSVVRPTALLRTTVVHHHQPTVYHAAPAVHLTPTAHIVHSAPATTLLKSSPTVITTHHSPAVVHHHSPAAAVVHHSPAVVHHAPATAVVHHHTPSLASAHHHQVSYVHYH